METDFSTITFAVEDGDLVMHAVARTSRKPYRHTCPRENLATIAYEIEDPGQQGISRERLHERTQIPWTRIQVALLFLNERSCIQRQGKRGRDYIAAGRALYEDAMVEYYALWEKGQNISAPEPD